MDVDVVLALEGIAIVLMLMFITARKLATGRTFLEDGSKDVRRGFMFYAEIVAEIVMIGYGIVWLVTPSSGPPLPSPEKERFQWMLAAFLALGLFAIAMKWIVEWRKQEARSTLLP